MNLLNSPTRIPRLLCSLGAISFNLFVAELANSATITYFLPATGGGTQSISAPSTPISGTMQASVPRFNGGLGTLTSAFFEWAGSTTGTWYTVPPITSGTSTLNISGPADVGGQPMGILSTGFIGGTFTDVIPSNDGDAQMVNITLTSGPFFNSLTGVGTVLMSWPYSGSSTLSTPSVPAAPDGFTWGGSVHVHYNYDEAVNGAVPEPSTFILAALGLGGLGYFAWRRRSRTMGIYRLSLLGVLFACAGREAQASLTLTTGLGTTQAGNLVQNGSFEAGTPTPTNGLANQLFWATGTTNSPLSVPTGWITSGGPNNYARWGNDLNATAGLNGSAPIPDGNFALYFGNGAPAMVNMAPTFNNNGTVTFASTPVATPGAGFTPQVVLQQTVNTVSNPSPYYRFSFWTSGEDVQSGGFGGPGIFGLRVTNVLAGNPMQWLTVPNSSAPLGNDHLYEYTFTPLNPLLNVTIEFHNFGHFDLAAWGGTNFTTELVLDDVIINTADADAVPEPATMVPFALGLGGLVLCFWVPGCRMVRRRA